MSQSLSKATLLGMTQEIVTRAADLHNAIENHPLGEPGSHFYPEYVDFLESVHMFHDYYTVDESKK